MPTIPVPFGEWLPDQPDFSGGGNGTGASVAKNVIPATKSYLPFPGQLGYSTSLGSRCIGAFLARDAGGNYYNFAGDESALYSLVGTSWSNVTRTSGPYGLGDDDFWEFTQFGTRIIAVGGDTVDPQVTSACATNFAALGGGSPRARHIATIKDFVVLGNLTYLPQSVRWCAINNVASWTADAATMADSQDLPGDSGWIQRVVGGEYGTIFQQRAIWRMSFVGSPLVFQFDKVHPNIGLFVPQAVVSHRNMVFFLAEDGFYSFDGINVIPIGAEKVDRTFFNDLDTTYQERIVAALDPLRKIVAWAYPSANAIAGNPDRMMIYHWPTGKWARIEDLNIEFILHTVTDPYSLDSLDNFGTNLDAFTLSLDSLKWSRGNNFFSCFSNSHQLNHFNGSAMAATVETDEIQLADGIGDDMLAYVDTLRPIAEGLSGSYQAAVGSRLNLTQSVSYGTASSPVSAGFVEVRNTNRYHRFRLTTTSATDFTHLMGVRVLATPAGER